MSQNISHAVMAQRVEALDSLDDFPTPPWATEGAEMSNWFYLASSICFAFGTIINMVAK